jgi:hypothetical protein
MADACRDLGANYVEHDLEYDRVGLTSFRVRAVNDITHIVSEDRARRRATAALRKMSLLASGELATSRRRTGTGKPRVRKPVKAKPKADVEDSSDVAGIVGVETDEDCSDSMGDSISNSSGFLSADSEEVEGQRVVGFTSSYRANISSALSENFWSAKTLQLPLARFTVSFPIP